MNCCGDSNKIDDTENQVVCPIMGGPINQEEAEKKGLVREYKGKKYLFCCDGCPEKFDKNPESYI